MTGRPTHAELIEQGVQLERARIRRALVHDDPGRVLSPADQAYVVDIIDGFSPQDAAMMAASDDWMATPEQLEERDARIQELAEGFEEYETDPDRATARALDQLYGDPDVAAQAAMLEQGRSVLGPR
jgi:hypothetical protein